ncbi:hypothetical protein [Dapis sp. BLCC M172]
MSIFIVTTSLVLILPKNCGYAPPILMGIKKEHIPYVKPTYCRGTDN